LKSKTVFIAITITLCLIIVGLGYYLYRQQLDFQTLANNYASLQQDYETLEQRHASLESEYNSLTSQYSALRSEHDALVSEYNALSQDYKSLQSKYSALRTDYNALRTKYNSLDQKYEKLFSDYQLLKEAFDKPLTYKQVPSIESLRRWLWYEDQTDTIKYDDPDFVCGDFAVMLAIHAKVKHWDMGVIGVWGYNRDTHEDYAHAFNAIITTEGLVYIEPQNDDVWWYENHEEISIGTTYEIGEDQWIYVEDVRIILQY
jgi:chaperonin cofactor prefoldin